MKWGYELHQVSDSDDKMSIRANPLRIGNGFYQIAWDQE